MRIQVYGPSFLKPPEVLDFQGNDTIASVKTKFASRNSEGLDKCLPIYGGQVLKDNIELNSLGTAEVLNITFVDRCRPSLGGDKDCFKYLETIVSPQIHWPLSSDQNHPSVGIEAFLKFVQIFSTDANSEHCWKPTEKQLKAINYAADVLKNQVLSPSTSKVTWLGSYGCALLANVVPVETVHLKLICLDGWHFEMFNAPNSRVYNSAVSWDGPTTLHVGCVQLNNFEKLSESFHNALEHRRRARENRKSFSTGQGGYHKTPGMVEAAIRDGIAEIESPVDNSVAKSEPRGGFTDVGRHTGGSQRNTSWPLVLAVVQAVIESCKDRTTFPVVEAELYLQLCESAVSYLSSRQNQYFQKDNLPLEKFQVSIIPSCEFKKRADSIMMGLNLAVRKACKVLENEHFRSTFNFFEARCIRVRFQLEEAEAAFLKEKSLSRDNVSMNQFSLAAPTLSVPAEINRDEIAPSLKEICLLSRRNCGMLPFQNFSGMSWSSLDCWLDQADLKKNDSDLYPLFCCRIVERYVYENFLSRRKSGDRKSIVGIESVLAKYRRSVQSLRSFGSNKSRLIVEIMSNEMLVIWTVFCLVHDFCIQKFPVLGMFDIAVDPDLLRNLVLSEKMATETCLHVFVYIKRNQGKGRPIFSLLKEDRTFDFASVYATKCAEIQHAWDSESSEAEKRQQSQWKVILQKKEKLIILDNELLELRNREMELITKKKSITTVHGNFINSRKTRSELQDVRKTRSELQDVISSLKGITEKIKSKKKEIENTEKAPPIVLQPLPQIKEVALQILFFIFIPHELELLGNLSFCSQQVTLPEKGNVTIVNSPDTKGYTVDIKAILTSKGPKVAWKDYYNNQSSGRCYHFKEVGELVLGSENGIEEERIRNVRHISNMNDNVWFPTSLVPKLYWKGGGLAMNSWNDDWFNPFIKICPIITLQKFTEKLPADEKCLQWAMCLGLSNDGQNRFKYNSRRGNFAEASQHLKPGWLRDKQSFIAYGSLRAYPMQQMRKICVILKEQALPFEHKAVRILFQQAMFQLGEILISGDGNSFLEWRSDFSNRGGWDTLGNELNKLADLIQFKSREHMSVLTLSEISSFGSQWSSVCRDAARRFANIAMKWAEDAEVQERCETDLSTAANSRAKRCLYFMYCIVNFKCGELDVSDVSQMCIAIVMSEYIRLFEDPTPLDSEVSSLSDVTRDIITRRLPDIIACVEKNPEILTKAINCVIKNSPTCLTWQILLGSQNNRTTVFEATEAGHIYTVNVHTGTVLFDGVPLQRLSTDILRHPLYKRVFSDRNFEVVRNSDGSFQTMNPISSRFYTFYLSPGTDELRVTERSEEGNYPLELLDGTDSGVDKWGKCLPSRLKRMHSHWICRESGIIILCPTHFTEHEAYFILRKKNEFDSSFSVTKWDCFQVPVHMRRHNYFIGCSQVLDEFDKLMILLNQEAVFSRAFEKFEGRADLIHMLVDSAGMLCVDFPRFGLQFKATREGHFVSQNFVSYRLSKMQDLENTLHGFTQYLIIEKSGKSKVIIPAGKVFRRQGSVYVHAPAEVDAQRKFHVYDIHSRFRYLKVSSGKLALQARLQLAALYAATTTLLPETRSGRTGAEICVELLRQSWTCAPLNAIEIEHLSAILSFSFGYPSIALLCFVVQHGASQVSFLFENQSTSSITLDNDAVTDYISRKNANQLSPRLLLLPQEEQISCGQQLVSRNIFFWISCFSNEKASFLKFDENFIATKEFELARLLEKRPPKHGNRPFPFQNMNIERYCLGRELKREMMQSWNTFNALPDIDLSVTDFEATETIRAMLETCRAQRVELEQDLILTIRLAPDHQSSNVRSFNLRRSANLEPLLNVQDLPEIALDGEKLLQFNPFFPPASVENISSGIIYWLQLCVFEERLERAEKWAFENDKVELIRELQEGTRAWSARDHINWLVFEVEQQLTIRNSQYLLTMFCVRNPGAITQLNMGEGKTRVILPMMIMYLANPNQITRVHFLAPLLGEAYDYLHSSLTASFLQRKIYLLPFSRNVKLDVNATLLMLQYLHECRQNVGVICLAPEHRLSLDLKWHELRLRQSSSSDGQVLSNLEEISNLSYIDLYDESDAILHHKYQLVYAVGECISLPEARFRWCAAQAILWQIQNDRIVTGCLSKIAVRKENKNRPLGNFDNIRLIVEDVSEGMRQELRSAVVYGIYTRPPYLMRCLENHPAIHFFIEFVTDGKKTLEWLKTKVDFATAPSGLLASLLALRGYLAYGILDHCLSKRFRVDFGIDSRRGKKQRTAVPFRASDTPSDRAEYAQPDTLIMFTHLAYYHGGLHRSELKEALMQLLHLNPVAQRQEYNLWITSVHKDLLQIEKSAVDAVEKIDPSNLTQFELLHRIYQFNMAAINFWLSVCVLPRETMQFKERIMSNAFHMASTLSRKIHGFSGTKDNKILLPLQVRQAESDSPDIKATDGKMLHLLMMNDRVHLLAASENLVKSVVDLAIRLCVNAIIDTGACMAGLSNRDAACLLLQHLPGSKSCLRGVVYYDQEMNGWTARDRIGRSWPLGNSPIHESEAFVFFDESRCRGSDMKLKRDASALVTVGPMMCREKLMQGAGRMRKLNRGQSLHFALPYEIYSRMSKKYGERSSCGVKELLQWILENTVETTVKGIPEWSEQANYFYIGQEPEARVISETISLEDLYSACFSKDEICNVVLKSQVYAKKGAAAINIFPDRDALNFMKLALERSKKYGMGIRVQSGTLSQECEREIEYERELEMEVYKETPRMVPDNQEIWDFASLLQAGDPVELPRNAGVMHLSEALQYRFRYPDFGDIRWDLSSIFVTGNFLATIESSTSNAVVDLREFMRPVDIVVVFGREGKVVLLSEWEADLVMSALEKKGLGNTNGPSLVNLSYMLEWANQNVLSELNLEIRCSSSGKSIFPNGSPPSSRKFISEVTIAALQLFAGHTMFPTISRVKALQKLVPTKKSKEQALHLVVCRGRGHLINMSDIEKVCYT